MFAKAWRNTSKATSCDGFFHMETSGDLEGNRAESSVSSNPREISVGMLSGAAHVALFASQEERSLLDPVSHY